jgi:hypothetical protein
VRLACHHNMIQGILAGSSRSGAPHNHFAKVSVERLDDRECRASERVGQIFGHNTHPDRGSDSKGFAPSHRPLSVGWRSIPPLGER